MVVYGHGLAVPLDGPCQRHHDLEAGQGDLEFVDAVGLVRWPCCQNLEKIVADKVRFCKAPRHVHAIRFFVVEANPALEISQNLERIVAEFVASIFVVDAQSTELQAQRQQGRQVEG